MLKINMCVSYTMSELNLNVLWFVTLPTGRNVTPSGANFLWREPWPIAGQHLFLPHWVNYCDFSLLSHKQEKIQSYLDIQVPLSAFLPSTPASELCNRLREVQMERMENSSQGFVVFTRVNHRKGKIKTLIILFVISLLAEAQKCWEDIVEWAGAGKGEPVKKIITWLHCCRHSEEKFGSTIINEKKNQKTNPACSYISQQQFFLKSQIQVHFSR